MNILIPDSWLREYLETNATPKDIQKCLSLCGPSIERAHKTESDTIYDVEVTTNRVDCMSVYGLAREAMAILPQFGFSAKLRPLKLQTLETGKIPGFEIKNDFSVCHRIIAVKVDGLKVGDSPKSLQDRLLAVSQRPLNNLVDITNYVMWETGHPTHVFDFDRLSTKKMIIREAKKGERITTLDEKTHVLVGREVVIDDGTGTIIDLPSIMGTSNSVVTKDTTSALFFVDNVKNSKVRFASMKHSIRTQAATLLEKDINPELSITAISRMIQLIKQIFPSARFSKLLDIYRNDEPPVNISLPISRISQLIGINIDKKQITDLLLRLNFQVKISKDILTVTPPAWRKNDIKIPEDIVEEVARIYGYHNIPPILMSGPIPDPDYDKTFYWENRIKTTLKYFGLNEIYSYSLVEKDNGLKLKNPLTTDWQYLRTSLFPSHQKIITQNSGRVGELNLFEIANVYLPKENNLPEEQSRLIVTSTNPDYTKFKGLIESLLADIGIPFLSINISSSQNIFYWEIPMHELLKIATEIKLYTPVSKFTPIVEDVNLIHSEKYETIVKQLKTVSPLIKSVELIDKFQDKLTLRLTFHSDEKQLSSEDVAPIRFQLSNLNRP